MVFVWRGWGLVVPIVFFIAVWLVGYGYDDVTIGDSIESGRLAWSFFWAGLANLLIGLFFRMNMSEVDQSQAEPGEVLPDRRRHDFFWIPVWLWGILMAALGAYMMFGGSDGEDSVYETEDSTSDEPTVIYEGVRKVEFYNPTEDTVTVDVFNVNGEAEMSESIPPTYMRWVELDAGIYTVKHDLGSEEIEVLGSDMEENERYDVAWYVVGGETDLILLHVNEACRNDINKTELAEIDWTSLIHKRYSGGSYLEPKLKMHGFDTYTVISPGIDLPLEFEEFEQIYSLIPIQEDLKTTEEYLDSAVIELCY